MISHSIVIILFRYLHVAAAAVAVGGVVFIRFVLPAGLRAVDAGAAAMVFSRCRRQFKFFMHACITLLLISGTYNAIRNWPGYSAARGLGHGIFSLHLLLGLGAIAISLWLLAGAEPRPTARKWLAVNTALLLLAILAASTLKSVRENATLHRANSSLAQDANTGAASR